MRRHGLPLAAVVAAALAVRVPLVLISSLPLNIDAFVQVTLAEEILSSGRWTLGEDLPLAYNRKLPGLPLFLAASSALTGVAPLPLATGLMVAVGLGTVVGGYALAWSFTRDRSVAAAAGFVLALLGPFLFVSATLIKEALGLALLPALLLLLLRRRAPQARLLAALLLLTLPLVHHLVTAVAHGFVALLFLLTHVHAHWTGRFAWRRAARDAATGPALFGGAAAYYLAVRMEFFADVWNPDEVALFLATALLLAAGGIHLMSRRRARPWFLLSKARRGPSLLDQKALVAVAAFLLVVANGVRPLVPGTVPTSPLLLAAAVGFLPLALLGLAGLNRYRIRRGPAKALPLALLIAPIAFLAFALLRGLDPLSHLLAYRTVDFLDLGLALVVGTGLVRAAGRRRRAVLAVLAAGALLATLPLAYATEATFQVQNTTYEYEMAAFRHLAETGAGRVATDQRMAAVLTWAFGLPADGSLPLRLRAGGGPPEDALLVLEGNWRTRGAQVHPLPFQRIDEGVFADLLKGGDLLYHGGSDGNPLFVVRLSPAVG